MSQIFLGPAEPGPRAPSAIIERVSLLGSQIVKARRTFGVLVLAALFAAVAIALPAGAQTAPAGTRSLEGVWVLNDAANPPANTDGRAAGRGGAGRGGARRGGFGGVGGSFGASGFGLPYDNSDRTERLRETLRDLTTPPPRLTIVQTPTIVIVTTGEGRTTRLAPNGKKIKDDNTGIERSTKWMADALVSEIAGLGSGKITQSFSVDPADHRLRVSVTLPSRQSGFDPPTVTHVYEAQAQP
jgi:hypothetical protein